MVEEYTFATLDDSREITAWKITNRWGEYATILSFGATIQNLNVFDKYGDLSNVVLCCGEGENPGNFRQRAGVMGRCGNRIAYGKFTINGKDYQLNSLRGEHHLHGGAGNYSGKIFTGTPGENSVTLYHHDLGEDGWESEADVYITYTFSDNHALTIDYSIKALGDTVISPTNHAYFNLDYPNSILDTKLKLFTETYAPKSELGMPDGRIETVAGTPLDFSKFKTIGDGLDSDDIGFFDPERLGYDDFYVIPGDGFRQTAEALNENSGRRMRVFSDAESLIFFTPTNDGYKAFCLEMQYVPNAVNCPEYRSPVFLAGETMTSRTVYAFDVL